MKALAALAACSAALAAAFLPPLPAAACGATSDCEVTSADGVVLGAYRFRPPEAGAGPGSPVRYRPALIFIHGWRNSAAGMMRTDGLWRIANEHGAVLVAPDGLGQSWSYPGSPLRRRDEFAFFDALREDLIAKRGVDPERILVSGFSMGGSMVWNLACRRGETYWGFAPLAGAFWDPIPERCPSPPRRLFHIHGTADRTVPIEGRPIGRSYRQSDAWDSFDALLQGMALTRGVGENRAGMPCDLWTAAEAAPEAPETEKNAASAPAFSFCRHDGGHFWKPEWLRPALERLARG